MTTEIHDRLDPEAQITDQELKSLFNKLKEKTCGTENITKTLEIQNVNQQRDAAECLELILNKVSQKASEVFHGQLTYTIKCFKGHIINEETNPFWTLPLPLKDTRDSTYGVESSFKKIFQTKTYTGDNMVYCNDCNDQTDATSGCEMVDPPQILILLLKRFDFDYNTMSHFKSDCCVEVPYELQLENKMYKLYGMVNHMGSLRDGHYTATILSDEDKCWYEFDDTHVKKVKEPFAETGPYKSITVYLLTYRAAESQTSPETNKLDDLRQDDVEPKRSLAERDADDGNEGQIRQNDTDEVQETSDEVLNSQTGGEEGTAETGKNNPVRSETEPEREPSNREKLREEKDDTAGEPECERFGSHDKDDESDGEISHIRDSKTDENCGTASEVENSVDVKVQDDLNLNQDRTHSSITQENTSNKSEEGKKHGVDDASDDREDQSKISFKHLDKGRRNKNKNISRPRRVFKPFCCSGPNNAEDEGLMRTDRKKERLQTRGEEGDEETGKLVLNDGVRSETEPEREPSNREKLREEKDDTAGEPECERFGSHDKDDESDGEISHIRDVKTDENCGTASEVENSVDVKAQDDLNVNQDRTHSSITQENTSNKSEEGKKHGVDDTSDDREDQSKISFKHLDKGRRNKNKNISRPRRVFKPFCCSGPNNAEDEGLMRTDRKKERLQTRGEEGDEETGKLVLNDGVRSETEPEREPSNREKLREEKDDTAGEPECERFGSHDKDDESDGEISHIRDVKTDENCGTASEVENSVDVKAQDDLNVNQDRTHSSITQENTSNKSEEGKKHGVDDTSDDREDQSKISFKHLDKGRRNKNKNISRPRRVFKPFCCSGPNNAEDEGLMRTDRKKERLQTRGEEGDEETGKLVLNDGVRSETESEREPSNREKLREEKDDTAGEPECERFGSHDKDDESDGEISHIRDVKTDENCGTASEVENSVDVKAQDNLNVNQHLDKGRRNKSKNISRPRRVFKPFCCSGPNNAEDEGLMRTDRKKERLQTRGEEGDEETGKLVLNDGVRSETESEREPSNREKLREEKDDTAGEPECERFGSHDKDDESDGEISHIRDVKTDENCGTASEVENSVDVKAQDNLNVNVVEQPKDSSEQHLDGTKEKQRATDCQKPVETTSEDVTDKAKEEQSEDKLK